jgi:hypothetical protein
MLCAARSGNPSAPIIFAFGDDPADLIFRSLQTLVFDFHSPLLLLCGSDVCILDARDTHALTMLTVLHSPFPAAYAPAACFPLSLAAFPCLFVAQNITL